MSPVSGEGFAVQVGSFSDVRNAENLMDVLIKNGLSAYSVKVTVGDSDMYRVRVGYYGSREEAERVVQVLNKLGYTKDETQEIIDYIIGKGSLVDAPFINWKSLKEKGLNEDELMTALLAGAEIIGINNRDLNTFNVDTNTTRRLRLLIPQENIVVSESGINNRDDIRKMKECKVNAILVGEALVTAGDIPAKMRELML